MGQGQSISSEHTTIKMNDAIDLSMSFEDDDDANNNDRPSSPHNTKETAIVIDDSSDDDEMAQKMPAAAADNNDMAVESEQTTVGSSSSAARSEKNGAVIDYFAQTQGTPNTCASCGKVGNNLYKCSACKSVHYCDRTCQHSHWSEHKVECTKNRSSTTVVKREQYAASSSARVSLSPTMNNHAAGPLTAATLKKRYGCSLCSERFITQNQKRKHEKKCRKKQRKRIKAEQQRSGRGVGQVKAEKQPVKEKEEGEDVEEADEITYTSYKPQKLKFGMDHPDPVVENSTLSAVEPPEVEYNLAMPADILALGKLSNLQLEAIVYGCQRHLIDLPMKEEPDYVFGEAVVEKPVRAGFLLGDGAGMGKGRTLAGFVVENLARGRKKHVWISVSSDLYEDAKRDLRDLGLGSYADTHCYNLGKLPYGDLCESHPEGVMFATYSTLISKNRQKQTRLDQLIEWCGGEDFEGLIMLDECHKAKTIELDADGNPKTVGKGSEKREKSSQTAKNVVNLQQALPRARVVYCSATSVSHPKNLGFMHRLALWGPGTEHPSGFNQFLDGLKRLGTGAMELHAMHLKSIGALCARTLSYESCDFELVDGISDEKVSALYNKASEIWTALHSQLLDRCTKLKGRDKMRDKIKKWSEETELTQEMRQEMRYHFDLHRDSDTESDDDDDDKLVEERRLRRTYREREAKNLLGLFWSAHQRFFRSLCIASKVDTAIALAKKALDDGNCCVIGLQSTGEARSKGAAAAAGINEDVGGSFEDFVSAPNEDLKRIIMMMFPLPPKPRGVIAPVFLNVNKNTDDVDDDVMEDSTTPSGQRYELGTVVFKEFEDPSTGKMRMYEGTVKKYFVDEQIYSVEFEDGDSEDMTEEEVARCIDDEELEKGTSSGRASRSTRRKTINYSEIHVDKDGNVGSSKGKKRKSSKKGSKSNNKKRRGTRSSISMANSDDESDFEAEQDEDDDDTIDADDNDFDTAGSSKQPAKGKSNKGKGKGPIKRIQWDEIDLNLDTSASVENERMVEYRKACERVKGWLDDVDDLALPANPLDRLLNELGGPDKVAELTGRKIRQIRRFDESKGKMVVFYEKRKGVGRFDQINVEERNNFQSGKKLVAILSEAASTGISLQADKRVGNQKRRVHITLELPWSADKAIQQLGRTHRANQSSGPSYKFLISDVGGEKRFAAAVAKRLALMGALTQGDRRATGQSNALGLGGFDFDNKFGKLALKRMLEQVWECHKNCLTDAPEKLVLDALKTIDSRLSEALDHPVDQPGGWKTNLAPYSDDTKSEQDHYKMMEELLVHKCPQLAEQRVKAIGEGKSVVKYLEKLMDGTETKEVIKPKIDEEVKAAMEAGLNFNVLCFLWLFDVGITEQSASGSNNYFKKGKPIDVPKFLNRTLGMNLLRQKLIVEHFIKHLGKQVSLAKREGTYDLGIKTISGHSVVIEKPRSFCFRGLEAKDERVLLYKVNLDRGMDGETALHHYEEAKALDNEAGNSSSNNPGWLGGGQTRLIKSGFYIDLRDDFKKVPRMFLIINQGGTSNKCVVIRPNEGKKTWTKDFVWNTLLHGTACRLTLCTDIDKAIETWKKEFDLANRPANETYQRYCYGRHTESCIFGGDIIPILNKILASSNLNGIGLANDLSLVMPDVVRVEPPGKTPEEDTANEAASEDCGEEGEDEDDSSGPPAVGQKVALKMLGSSFFRGAITECKDEPESFVTTFTDGSIIEMNTDEVNKARQLFDAEWTKLVVDAEVPKAVASSIEVHNSVNSEAQGTTRRPILPAGEEKTTEDYEKIFEEEYDGEVPNVLVGLEFPKRTLNIFSQSANEHKRIPFWEFVLRKLAERLLEEGTHSSRDLLNLENAEKIKLQQG